MNNPTLDTGSYWRMNGRGIRSGSVEDWVRQSTNAHRDGMNRTWEVRYIGFRIVRNKQ